MSIVAAVGAFCHCFQEYHDIYFRRSSNSMFGATPTGMSDMVLIASDMELGIDKTT